MKDSDSAGSPELASGRFNTTHWSVVLLAGQNQSPQSAAALEQLCRAYWHPLYAFIRRQGQRPEDAQDSTQAFFARLFERKDLMALDQRKGKFRTFLLTALTHFLSNERDYARAAKRGGGLLTIPLEEVKSEELYRSEATANLPPDKVFDLRWGMTVLEKALARMQQEMADERKSRVFTELKSFLTDDPGDGEYALAAERLEMPRQSVAVAVHRLRQRYRELVRAEVAQTVSSPLELEEEMRHLFAALSA